MSALEDESGIWDERYRSAATEEERIVQQDVSENVMNLPEPIHAMLDVGCGTGDMVMAWAQHGAAATGLDISAQAIQSARAASCAAQLQDNCSFVVGDWTALELDAYDWRHAFDLVFSAMGPDMRDPASLQKMNTSSRGYCRLLIFHDGQNALAELASQRLGLPLPPSPPGGEVVIRAQLSAYTVFAEDVVCRIAYEAPTARWRSYLQQLFPAQSCHPLLDEIIQEQGGCNERMIVQTDAVYRMLTWKV